MKQGLILLLILTLSSVFLFSAFGMHMGIHDASGCVVAALQGNTQCPASLSSLAQINYHAGALSSLVTTLVLVLLVAAALGGLVFELQLSRPKLSFAYSRKREREALLSQREERSWLAHLEHSPTVA